MNETSSYSTETVQETAAAQNFSLSVIGGLALLGLLVTAIWDFAGFTNNEQSFFLTHIHKGNYKLLAVVSVLFEAKMLSLLAMVFGAGIVLLVQKQEHPSAIDGTDAYIRRQIWLIILGLFVALIILWPNDILFPFGVVGILLFAFYKLPAKKLFITAIICTLIFCGKQYWNYADDQSDYKAYLAVKTVEKKFADDSVARAKKFSFDKTKDSLSQKPILAQKKLADSLAKKKDTLNGKQAEEKGKWEGLVKNLKYDSSKSAADKKSMRAGYSKMWFYLKGRTQNKESNWLYGIGVWDIGSAMLLGMALLGLGFFYKKYAASTYLLTGLLLLAIGFAFAWLRIHNNTLRLTDYAKYIDDHILPYNQFVPLEKLAIATGYASLLMWLLKLDTLQWLTEALSAVGRLALTNYFLMLTICAFWFYGYGLGFYGRFAQWELYVAVTQIAVVLVLFSVLWLRNYRLGPLEWALKSLVYRKKLPNKL